MTPNLTPNEIAAYYAERAPNVAQRGSEWRGPCPRHNGTRDSFAVNPETGASYCHSECNTGWDPIGLEMVLTGVGFKPAEAEINRIVGRQEPPGERRNGHARRTVAEYTYTDANGLALFQVVRFEPKDFRQRHPDGDGNWIWNSQGVKQVPYRLPQVLGSKSLCIVEGERDVHAGESIGCVCTCNPMGAGKWKRTYNEHFRAKDVTIIPDNDEPGRKHAGDVAQNLLTVTDQVRIVELPRGKDLSDWLKTGGNRAELDALIEHAPVLTVTSLARWRAKWEPKAGSRQQKDTSLPEVVNAEELLSKDLPEPKPIIEALLYAGVTLLIGRPKVGKSWFALSVALALVSGQSLAGRFRIRTPGRVLYLALEESQTRTVSRIRRLVPIVPDGIRDLKFVYVIESLQGGGAAQIDDLLAKHPAEVLIVDTLLAASRATNRSSDIVRNDYAEISLFSEIAKKHNCAILLVHHSRKDSGQHDDVDAIIGTSGTSAAVDAIWHLKRGKGNGALLLSTVGREIEREQYEFALDLDKGGFLFTASGEDVNRSEQQKEIVELLENEERAMSPEAIARALGKNRSTIRRLLQKLYQDDVIRKSLKGQYFVDVPGRNIHAA